MDICLATSTLGALADSTRLRLLSVLAEGSLSVTELSSCLTLSQPRVSHHLGILLRARLVRVRREGVRAYYSCESRGEAARVARSALATLEDQSVRDDCLRAARFVADRKAERREFFAAMAETWPANLASWIDLDTYRGAVARFLPRGASVADLGCGTGWLLPTLASVAARVIGVDHAPEVLAQARRQAHEAGLTCCEFRLGELEHLPLREHEVEVVFVGLVLHSMPDPQAALDEAARICTPGGALLVIEPLAHSIERARDELGALWLGFTEAEMIQWVTSAGFIVTASETFVPPNGLHLLAVRADRKSTLPIRPS